MGPNFVALGQWFLTGGDFAPQGASVNVGGISDHHNWEGYWHRVGRHHGCF